MNSTISIKLNNTTLPYRGSELAAGYDLFATNLIQKDDLFIYDTGISIELPKGTFGMICPRSSVYKTGLILTNSVGVIDEDYRGEIRVMFYKLNDYGIPYNIGDRIAQLIVIPKVTVMWNVVDNLTDTGRGIGGFGSTGLK